MWIIVMGVLSSWLIIAVAVSFGLARAIKLRDTHASAPPAPLRAPEVVRVLAA